MRSSSRRDSGGCQAPDRRAKLASSFGHASRRCLAEEDAGLGERGFGRPRDPWAGGAGGGCAWDEDAEKAVQSTAGGGDEEGAGAAWEALFAVLEVAGGVGGAWGRGGGRGRGGARGCGCEYGGVCERWRTAWTRIRGRMWRRPRMRMRRRNAYADADATRNADTGAYAGRGRGRGCGYGGVCGRGRGWARAGSAVMVCGDGGSAAQACRLRRGRRDGDDADGCCGRRRGSRRDGRRRSRRRSRATASTTSGGGLGSRRRAFGGSEMRSLPWRPRLSRASSSALGWRIFSGAVRALARSRSRAPDEKIVTERTRGSASSARCRRLVPRSRP